MMSVKIYTSPTCHFCDKTKEFFKENSIEYTEINVREDPKAQEEAIEKSGQAGVPVVDIDGEIVVGFDKPALKKALKMDE